MKRASPWTGEVGTILSSDDTEDGMSQYAFGWLGERLEVSDPTFEIRPLNSFDRAVEVVKESARMGPAWFYPPIVTSSTEGVDVPVERFALPSTHLLVTPGRPYDEDYGAFAVIVLGFLLGLRFTIEGTGHLRPTPWKRGTLVGFVPTGKELLACLHKATTFWDSNTAEVRRLMFGAVHWHLTAQSYDHQYERFAWAYTVMDNLHRVAWHTSPAYKAKIPNAKGQHGERPKALAAVFGSPLPKPFTDPAGAADNVAVLVAMRNELVHEGRWAGEPLGYAADGKGHDIIMHLDHFCAQVILGVLDIDCRYRKVEYSYQIHGLDVVP